jgi:hypothetical protein
MTDASKEGLTPEILGKEGLASSCKWSNATSGPPSRGEKLAVAGFRGALWVGYSTAKRDF